MGKVGSPVCLAEGGRGIKLTPKSHAFPTLWGSFTERRRGGEEIC